MRHLALVVMLGSLVSLSGCAGHRPPSPKLPPPVLNYSLGPGDVFEVYVRGEERLNKEYRVHPDGTIVFPYVDSVTVGGLEPQQVEALIAKKLVEGEVLKHPQVTLVVKQYASKRITVTGSVGKPGAVTWTEGIRLVDAISQAGGFTPLADKNHVTLQRRAGKNRTITVRVSVEAITDGQQPDIPLQAGDTITVDQSGI